MKNQALKDLAYGFLWILILNWTVPALADVILIVRKDGNSYTYDTDTRQVVAEIQHDAVYLERGLTPTPGDPADPGMPTTPTNPPADDPVAERAYNLAASIGNKQDAAIVAAIYQKFGELFQAGDISETDLRSYLPITRRVALDSLKSDWTAAFKSLDDEMKTAELKTWLPSVAKGLASYAGTSPESLLQKDSEQPENLDLGSILAIIEEIIKLLKQLGILN